MVRNRRPFDPKGHKEADTGTPAVFGTPSFCSRITVSNLRADSPNVSEPAGTFQAQPSAEQKSAAGPWAKASAAQVAVLRAQETSGIWGAQGLPRLTFRRQSLRGSHRKPRTSPENAVPRATKYLLRRTCHVHSSHPSREPSDMRRRGVEGGLRL